MCPESALSRPYSNFSLTHNSVPITSRHCTFAESLMISSGRLRCRSTHLCNVGCVCRPLTAPVLCTVCAGVCVAPPRIITGYYARGSLFSMLGKARDGNRDAQKALHWPT